MYLNEVHHALLVSTYIYAKASLFQYDIFVNDLAFTTKAHEEDSVQKQQHLQYYLYQ